MVLEYKTLKMFSKQDRGKSKYKFGETKVCKAENTFKLCKILSKS